MEPSSAENDRLTINNAYYHSLGEAWYTKQDDPIALLRAESRVKVSWILPQIAGCGIDVGCGGGFATNELAVQGFKMTGLDISNESLQIAQVMDSTKSVRYVCADAYHLPFENDCFDFAICLDFLEHVTNPHQVIREISRVMKPGGKLIFHTFNRNWLSRIVVIKGMEWFIKNTPPKLHVYDLFLKPEEVEKFCVKEGLNVTQWTGCRPVLNREFWTMLSSGIVSDRVQFKLTASRAISYLGCAVKGPGEITGSKGF